VIRSWIAISLVMGLPVFCATAFLINDASLRSTLYGGLIASVGAAIAFYFSSKAADQSRADVLNAAVTLAHGGTPLRRGNDERLDQPRNRDGLLLRSSRRLLATHRTHPPGAVARAGEGDGDRVRRARSDHRKRCARPPESAEIASRHRRSN
jgi:hypothetical protein